MLSRLTGTLVEKQPPCVLLDVHGVGYELHLPMTCFFQLPGLGCTTTLFTHFWVREDAQTLYGFQCQTTRALFRALIKVNGVGPKLALAILSGLSAKQFVEVVAHGDLASLTKLPGVGKKTAERLLIEMRDRCADLLSPLCTALLPSSSSLDSTPEQPAEKEAITALISLGYKAAEANKMVQRVTKPGMDCEWLIRQALRQL